MTRAAPLPFRPTRQPAKGAVPSKGRGARSNASGRYEQETRQEIDDGWAVCGESQKGGEAGETFPPDPARGGAIKTTVTLEVPRKIVTRNTSPDVGFDRSINPYRGCEHGCIYCFARTTHAYIGLSPGLDFETKLIAKPNAAALLEKELSASTYRPRTIAIGTNTDAYQPIERRYRIMRRLLQVLDRFNHPVSILTKSDMVLRDLDILAPMATRGLVRVMLSITTNDRSLARHMEPRATTPKRRFEALRKISEAGIPTGIMIGPIIPAVTDCELETLLEQGAASGAQFAAQTIIRLPLEISPLFQEWLATTMPDRADRVMRHIREMNGGRDYDAAWSRGGDVKGTYAALILTRFNRAIAKYGLDKSMPPLETSQFRVPQAVSGQGDLFG